MRVQSFKLRFTHRHVRIEIDGEAGVDLSDEAADALFALAGPLLQRLGIPEVRALSVDFDARRLLASPPLRIEGDAFDALMADCSPLIGAVQATAEASIARRAARGELVRETGNPAKVEDLSLVLTAVGVPHVVDPPAAPGGQFGLFAPAEQAADARAALDAYEAENAPTPAAPAEPDYGETVVGLVFALLLLAWFALPLGSERGAADAEKILAGEWWRAATALTLHADAAHAGGNAALGAIALTALARRLGPAAAAWIALAAGIGGNLLTALSHRQGFVSVGASTAVFGLLGALGGAQWAGPRRARHPWVALAATAALLGLMGTGERADLLAHLYGAVCGLILGAASGFLLPRAPRRSLLQPLGAAASVVVLGAAWALALS